MIPRSWILFLAMLGLAMLAAASAQAQERPNILVIWGDDVGWSNLSSFGDAVMQHLQTLADYPPVQGGASFDMSNVVEQFINSLRQ
jgi:hypothetical protein